MVLILQERWRVALTPDIFQPVYTVFTTGRRAGERHVTKKLPWKFTSIPSEACALFRLLPFYLQSGVTPVVQCGNATFCARAKQIYASK
jgi:hypothetical protein